MTTDALYHYSISSIIGFVLILLFLCSSSLSDINTKPRQIFLKKIDGYVQQLEAAIVGKLALLVKGKQKEAPLLYTHEEKKIKCNNNKEG